MATQAQIDANRRNAEKSTGPKTEAGKAKSSKNRLSHGFNSQDPILPDEDPAQFDALLEALVDEYHPATFTEQALVEKMALYQWFSLRAIRLQTGAFKSTLRRAAIFSDGESAVPSNLAVLIRYHNSSDRAFLRMRTELLNAQKQRKNCEIGFEPRKPVKPQPPTTPEPENPADFEPHLTQNPLEDAPEQRKMAA